MELNISEDFDIKTITDFIESVGSIKKQEYTEDFHDENVTGVFIRNIHRSVLSSKTI